jgi:hypothetical protein
MTGVFPDKWKLAKVKPLCVDIFQLDTLKKFSVNYLYFEFNVV